MKILIEKYCKILHFTLTFTCFVLLSLPLYGQINKLDEKNLEETMRNPWKAEEGNFIKDWLILGGFPSTKIEDIDIDFLANYGGEKDIQPHEGQIVKLQDGSEIRWQKYHSNEIIINLRNVFEHGRLENVVAYAYTEIERKEAGKTLLCLGSDDGVKVWLNGKEVHRSLIFRAVTIDEDVVEVNMNAGVNRLLVKIQQGTGDWGFAFRIKDDLNNISQFLSDIQFSITKTDNKNNIITVESTRRLKSDLFRQPITMQVYTTGGKIVFETVFQSDEPVYINYKDWKEGVYEIRLRYFHIDGTPQTYYLSWFKGDILKTAKEIVNSIPRDNIKTPENITHKMLADMIMNRLGGNLKNPDSSKLKNIHSPLMEYAEIQAHNQIRPGGFIRLAYIDDIDGTPQFCRAYLPLNYDPSKKFPMVVYLHGYNGENPEYINWWSADKRNDLWVDRYNFILIEPHGRGNTSYLGIGDRDVMKCIEMAKEKFSVDEDRVYLNGESMGGGGTWNVGSRHPEVFAAIAPVYGGWDYHVNMNKETLNSLGTYEKYYRERYSSTAQFESLLDLPVFAFHGDRDKTVDVNYTRYLVRLLQRWGYNIRYFEVPEKGHGGLGHRDILYSWLLQQKRSDSPGHVRLRAADLRTASAYWVKATQKEKPWELMNVDANVFENNVINIDTKNVLELVLTPGEKLINFQNPIKVIWNTKLFTFDKPPDGKINLKSSVYQKGNLNKTPEISGPIGDFVNTPFAIVMGTTSRDNTMKILIELKVKEIINIWKNQQKFEPRVFKDFEVTESDMEKYSLHLIGGPKENKVSKVIFEKIPFRISSGEIVINEKIFNAKDAVLDAIYPNPFNQQRYVRITAATSGPGMYFFDPHRTDVNNYDFYISDGKIPNTKAGFPLEKICVAFGMFNNNWQIQKEYLKEGIPELRVKCPEMVIGKDLVRSVKGEQEVPLEILKSYVGSYKFIDQGFEVKILIKDGVLMGQGPNSQPVRMFSISNNDFFILEQDLHLSFMKEKDKMILILNQGGQEINGEKAP